MAKDFIKSFIYVSFFAIIYEESGDSLKDKSKIAVLYFIIIFVSLLIVGLAFVVYLSIRAENKGPDTEITTTTRRTIDKEESTSKKTTTSTTSENGTSIITTSTSSSISLTTKKTTTSKGTTTKRTTKKSTTKRPTTTKPTTKPIIPDYTHPITNGPTDYPGALDDWEWNIVDKINDLRVKNGLNRLSVASDMRTLAEEAADIWEDYGQEEMENYVDGYGMYAMKNNNLSHTNGYNTLYQNTINKTPVATRQGLRYIGVGVIFKEDGFNGIPTHYYVIIYE